MSRSVPLSIQLGTDSALVVDGLLTTSLDGPATALMCFRGGGLAGVVVVARSATVFDEGGFAERSSMRLGIDDNA